MKERPIIFSGQMVKAILDGRKTQSRRVVKDMPNPPIAECHPWNKQKHSAPYFDAYCGERKTDANPRGMSDFWCYWQIDDRQCFPLVRCPYGKPGDRLWVRETFCKADDGIHYRADGYEIDEDVAVSEGWNPSIHMPRAASRITLEIVSVRVERLQEISGKDAKAEGADYVLQCGNGMTKKEHDGTGYIEGFQTLWDSINGKTEGKDWQSNPWVWVVEFRRVEVKG